MIKIKAFHRVDVIVAHSLGNSEPEPESEPKNFEAWAWASNQNLQHEHEDVRFQNKNYIKKTYHKMLLLFKKCCKLKKLRIWIKILSYGELN